MKAIITAAPLIFFSALASAASNPATKAPGSDLLGIGLLFGAIILVVAGVFWYVAHTNKSPDQKKD